MLACALLVAVGASGVQLGASRVGAARAAVASRRFAPRVLRAEPETAASADVADDGLTDKQREIQRLRDAEVFMVKDTGRYECRTCSYVYDPEKGDGFLAKPGTPFSDLSQSWTCPQCQSPKPYFESQMLTIAGFAENQDYGFGGNSMTEGQKSNLIFGGLFAGFVLLMSGYLLT
ncbi:hypothetical protein KFE25_004730 [Diacronema lutheri]|uniref:Rubredoxin-like domain-containing protein n=1 Tax=Diacronema lutheri TaxID=2081491 RepID=A0A8J5XLB6_DIALT|nr:hypothetical protein KFE25_004730 [Diacronema lutheri]